MTPADVAEFAMGLPEATESEPGPGMTLFKVGGKIFAVLTEANASRPDQVTLKCDPDLALHLREQYQAVGPSYYARLPHWNTVALDGTVPADELADMIEHSWDRVVAGLPRTTRDRLQRLHQDQP
ncbi:MmcQ/YjbR family DNA-binding protein [Streptomyces yunnanensis]|uniref:Predicted DNA-binding protein, MmcQ/YjbR family n=1 Tax=Streptomyces yunnanensis TaxID=156453 RepID=A0A9X8MU98_9ACTN|nr:MmcQ/YjbR family DNA-binding protein [Streptomyces yunnanensis]SHL84015.1 Predicted DNA-binding protein, MmcQ/YjbR family [Streptomyces yunnanensis]